MKVAVALEYSNLVTIDHFRTWVRNGTRNFHGTKHETAMERYEWDQRILAVVQGFPYLLTDCKSMHKFCIRVYVL